MTIRVVADDNYPPFLFREPSGRAVGYTADWWRLWESKTGTKVDLKALKWADAQSTLLRGEADVIDLMFRTPDRETHYDFTSAYATVPVAVYVHAGITGIQDVRGLRGFTVGAMEGDACIEMLRVQGVDNLRLYASYTALIKAALADDVRLFCMDEYPANYYIYHEQAQHQFRKAFQLYQGQFHRAVRKGDLSVLSQVQRGAAMITADEEEALRAKWMPAPERNYAAYVKYAAMAIGALLLVALAQYAWMRGLRTAVQRRTEELHEAQTALGERVKEQACLYAVFGASEDLERPLSDLVRDVARLLPPAWYYPDVAVARVECLGAEHATGDLAGAIAEIHAPIFIDDIDCGRVTVAYLAERPREAEGPFLAEERVLIDAVAERLASVVQRRRLAEQAERRDEIFHAIVEQANDSITLMDVEDGQFVEFNEAAYKNLGYERDEYARMHVPDLEASMTPEQIQDVMQRIQREGGTEFETKHRHKNGEARDVRVSARLLTIQGREYLATLVNDITERKATEQRLHESEDLFRTLFEDTRQAITLIDDGRFIAANKASLEMLGTDKPDDLIGRSPVDISPSIQPDGRASAEKAAGLIAKAFAQGSIRFEWQHLRVNGDLFDAEVLLTAIHQAGKDMLHVVWTDITAEKQAEHELQDYRENLEALVEARTREVMAATDSLRAVSEEQRAIFEAAGTGIVLLKDRIVQRCNRRMEEMFGYGHGEMVGLATTMLYADALVAEKVGSESIDVVSRGSSYAMEELARRRDGSEFWAHVTARAIDPDKLELGIVAVVEDISAERLAAENLRQAYQEQQAIFDTASSGVALIKDRILVRCNQRMHTIFGWPDGELVGKPTRIWYADEEGDHVGAEPYAQIWAGISHRREQQLVRRDGSHFWARLTGTAVDVHDRSKGTVWVIDDISTERELVDEMRRATALAEDAARTKSNFLANMSHEIRTPMNAIIGLTHLVLQSDLSTRQRDYLEKIHTSSNHLLGIVNDILDFSKIDAGKLRVESAQFRLDSVLDNISGLIADNADSKGLEFIIDVAPEVPDSLVGDPLRLGQILINFANNAVKFTQEGEITLSVQRDAQFSISDGRVRLRFEVRDTGIGLSQAQTAQLFQSFTQADNSTTRRFGGTGLGLVISKSLAELMGGTVGVNSQLGEGSTFWLSLELGLGQGDQEWTLPPVDLLGRSALVVDDQAHAREVTAGMLRTMGFSVDTATCGPEAIESIRDADASGQPYAFVILDARMPDMNGSAVARAVRHEKLTAQPRLVLASTTAHDKRLGQAGQKEFDALLQKPIIRSTLLAVVNHLFAPLLGEVQTVGDGLPGTREPSLAGARVLLVEDNDLNQQVASDMLRSKGILVDIAEDGSRALQMVDHGYDLVLMDMQMPVMDGLTATRTIRQQAHLTRLPIVAMTANAMESDRQRCIEAGMDDYLAKPIEPEALWAMLRKWIAPRIRLRSMPPAVAEVVKPALPEGIDGLDVQLGLQRTQGNAKLYLSLLRHFANSEADFGTRLEAAMSQSKTLDAERLVHTLKGNAGTLGAIPLQQSAARLNSLLLQHAVYDDPAVRDATEDMIHQLGALLVALSAWLANHEPGKTLPNDAPVELDGAWLEATCNTLGQLIRNNDFAARKLLEQHGDKLATVLGDDLQAVIRALNDYDYDSALEAFLAARSKTVRRDGESS
jgi:two-component system sensor histidine kinase/response regulator